MMCLRWACVDSSAGEHIYNFPHKVKTWAYSVEIYINKCHRFIQGLVFLEMCVLLPKMTCVWLDILI